MRKPYLYIFPHDDFLTIFKCLYRDPMALEIISIALNGFPE